MTTGRDRRRWLLPLLALASGCTAGGENPLGPSVNRAPVIHSVTVSPTLVLVGGTAVVQVDAVDPDGDRLFYRYAAEAGSVIPDASNPARATYIQSGAPRVSDTVTVTVTDARNASATATATVDLQANRPPQVTARGGGSCHPRPECTQTFTAAATDPDGDALTYTWSGCASGEGPTASCTITGIGTFTATVVVSDGHGGVASSSASAEGTNRPPVVTGGTDYSATRARFLVNDDDPDGDPLTCGWWGNCLCEGSSQSFNLICSLPSDLSTCFERFSCTDPFGASAETTFHLNP